MDRQSGTRIRWRRWPRTLRRRWDGFVGALVLIGVAGAVATAVVVTEISDRHRRVTEEVTKEYRAVEQLRAALEAETSAAHFIRGSSQSRAEFRLLDARTTAALQDAAQLLNDSDEIGALEDIGRRWDHWATRLRAAADEDLPDADRNALIGDVGVFHTVIDTEMDAVREHLKSLAAIPIQDVRGQVAAADRAQQKQLALFYALIATCGTFVLVVGRRVRRDVFQPIGELRKAAGRVAAGDLAVQLPVHRSDELGELACSFNAMQVALAATQNHLTAQIGRNRAVIETAGPAFLAVDSDGVILDWNRRAEEIFGWSRAQAVGRTVGTLCFPAATRSAHYDRLASLRDVESVPYISTPVETVAMDQTGRTFPVEIVSSVIEEDGHRILNAFLQDITERKEAADVAERLAAIVDCSDDAIVGLTADLTVTSWNPGAERLYGYASEEVLGRPINFLLPPDVAREPTALARVARGERLLEHETRVRTRSGRIASISLAASPLVDATGAIVGVASIAHDLTDRLAAEELLRFSERRFRSLVQRSAGLTLVVDEKGVVTFAGGSSVDILGRPQEALIGRRAVDLVAAIDRRVAEARYHEVRRSADGSSVECRALHADGSLRTLEVCFTNLIKDPAVGGVVLNVRDITEHRRLEAELRHAQKLESVGQLAAGIAHEINTPIQFVGDNLGFLQSAFADLLQIVAAWQAVDGASDSAAAVATARATEEDVDVRFLVDEVPVALDQTLDGVGRVATIVRAMKAFGHPSGEEKAPADLNEAVRTTLVVANNQLKYAAEVVTDLGDLPPVWCHLSDVNQIVLNLVVNAAQAISGAGRGRGTISVRTRVGENDVVLEVADDGPGIPADIADRIFEPFFTTKDVGVGTGQGLALVYSLTHDRHGGTVTFTSRPDAGTTFFVRLPIGAPVPVGGASR